jgi:hypothetical protein
MGTDLENNRYVVLLTTCVDPVASTNADIAARRDLYVRNIKRYLDNTNLHIAVIESSGHTFDIPSSHRFQQATIDISNTLNKAAKNVSTVGEAISVLKAQELGLLNGFTHAIKVTGKYYLPDLEKEILKMPSSAEIVYQHISNGNTKWQNSEVFGFNVKLLKPIYDQFLANEKGHLFMEQGIYDIHLKLGVESYRLPPLQIHEKVARGDGSILPNL